MDRKQKEQAKSTPALAPESITSQAELLSQVRRTREASVTEFRAGAPYIRTVRELQQSFTEHFLRWCDTFPTLLARYREHLISTGLQSDDVARELQEVVSAVRQDAKSWISLACDGEFISPEWRCPAWFVEYPIKANSPSAHMPVERIVGRRLDMGADEILRALGDRFEKKLTLGSALPTTAVPGVPNPPHSDDYRSIWYKGKWHPLTEWQAKIVEAIHSEHKRGIPEVSRKSIMRKVGTPASRLSDSFRKSRLWGTFIAPGTTRGTVRLDWPDTPSVQK